MINDIVADDDGGRIGQLMQLLLQEPRPRATCLAGWVTWYIGRPCPFF